MINNNNTLDNELLRNLIINDFELVVLDTTESTNSYAKEFCSDSVCLTIADSQTSGRGRLGRSFASPKGRGIYMTISFKPEFGPDKVMLLTALAGVAVCRAVKDLTGLEPKIKWVNDIILGGKKLAGILAEGEVDPSGDFKKFILGIGLNCYDCELPDVATNLEDELNKEGAARAVKGAAGTVLMAPGISVFPGKSGGIRLTEGIREVLAVRIAKYFLEYVEELKNDEGSTADIFEQYRKLSCVLGEDILIYQLPDHSEGVPARAIDVDERGGLVVQLSGGEKMTLTTGEVTIRKR